VQWKIQQFVLSQWGIETVKHNGNCIL